MKPKNLSETALKYRYPGTQPFTAAQRSIFFGRTEDIERLYTLLSLEQLVILYARSGIGKSSLINAGIIPKMRSENYFEPFSVRFGNYMGEEDLTPLNISAKQLAGAEEKDFYLDKLIPNDNSLWYFLKRKQAQAGHKEFILIFDQFEELLSHPEEDVLNFKKALKEVLNHQIPHRFRAALEAQFSAGTLKLSEEELALFHNNIKVKALLAIRSDRMSLLNSLKDYFPNILRHCYELEALSAVQAKEAIVNPAYDPGKGFISPAFDYENEALNAILRFLTKDYTQKAESFQLQLLCQNMEQTVIEERLTQITESRLGDIESIYRNHYDNVIKNIGTPEEQLAARKFIEEGLIFEEEERRLLLYEGQITKIFGVSHSLLKRLTDSHLLRAEPNPKGGYSYELCHDTLISPILRSKRMRIELKKMAKEAKLLRLLFIIPIVFIIIIIIRVLLLPNNPIQLKVFVLDANGKPVLENKGILNITLANRLLNAAIDENGKANFANISPKHKGDSLQIGLQAEGWKIAGPDTFVFTNNRIILKVKRDNSLGIIKGRVANQDREQFIENAKVAIKDTVIYTDPYGFFEVILPVKMRVKSETDSYELIVSKEGYKTKRQYHYPNSSDADIRLEKEN